MPNPATTRCRKPAPLLPARAGVAEGARDGARLLALNPALGVNCALLVDRLSGLRNADQLTAVSGEEPVPENRPAFAGARWRDAEGRLWQEIGLAVLAANEEFLGVAG